MSAVILLGAVLNDVAFRTIPNWMSATLLVLGIGIRMQGGGLAPGLLTCVLILFGAGFCWRRGWLGGGDVKLLAACGVLAPPGLSGVMLLDVALAGGVLALLYLALGRVLAAPGAACPPGRLRGILWAERHRIHSRSPMPYASAIAVGALLVLYKG
jgi:prepilin peptidase CpaA